MTESPATADGAGAREPGIGAGPAAVLVFGASAAVLVVEIVALRLLAPYFGLSLETSTMVIGIALAAIAFGSWAGGRIADLVEPHRLLGPALGISGAVVALTPAAVRGSAEAEPGLLLPAASLAILVPGALLSAVTPIVTKLRLTSLEETGTIVGRLSGIGTVGAIVGTVLTGFVLVSWLPVSGILLGLGVLLVVSAVLVQWRFRQGRDWTTRATAIAVAAVPAGAAAILVAPGGCDVETRYHCARVVADPAREGGRTLVLDGVRHSYVDLDDPTHLEFAYIRAIAAVDAHVPAGEPVAAYHLGGGGLTFPRYLEQERPGTRSLVSEIDGGVVTLDRDRLGLGAGTGVRVRVEDGRLGLRRLPDDGRDLVVGDAFGGASVPWHLTTVEALSEVRRVLAPDGLYVANLIDHGDLAFARAEAATVARLFEHVALVGEPGDLDPDPQAEHDGGNLVLVASGVPLHPARIRDGLAARETGWVLITGATLARWVDGADPLTDDRAPVDQLLQPYRAGG